MRGGGRPWLVAGLMTASSRSTPDDGDKIVDYLGVVVSATTLDSPAMRSLSAQGIERARLLTYTSSDIEKTASALGPGSLIVATVPDDEVENLDADAAQRICMELAPWIRLGVVDLVVVGVTARSGVGESTAQVANACAELWRACDALSARVAVSTSVSLASLRSSFPPSASLFAAPEMLAPVLGHLRATSSPLVVELDPYLAWRRSYYDVSLEYATFARGFDRPPEFVDWDSGQSYWNLFDAMLDGMRWALYREDYGDLELVIGAVGWPSGGADLGASVGDAARFTSNLARHVAACDAISKPPPPLTSSCVPTFVYRASDDFRPSSLLGAEDSPGLLWGVCEASGAPKYSLRTGEAFDTRTSRTTPIDTRGNILTSRGGRAAIGVLAAAIATFCGALACYFAWRRRTFRHHSPDYVANVIRASKKIAAENLLQERIRRFELDRPYVLHPVDELDEKQRTESMCTADTSGSFESKQETVETVPLL